MEVPLRKISKMSNEKIETDSIINPTCVKCFDTTGKHVTAYGVAIFEDDFYGSCVEHAKGAEDILCFNNHTKDNCPFNKLQPN